MHLIPPRDVIIMFSVGCIIYRYINCIIICIDLRFCVWDGRSIMLTGWCFKIKKKIILINYNNNTIIK